MTAQPKDNPKCMAYGGTITFQGIKQEVYCVLPPDHKGKHRAAPLGRLQSWEGTFKRADKPKLRVVNPFKMQKCKNGHITLYGDWCYACEAESIRQRYDMNKESVSVAVEPRSDLKPSWWRRLWNWLRGK